jgi:hypothetical protein
MVFQELKKILLTVSFPSRLFISKHFFNIHYYELSFADKVVEGQRRGKLHPEQYSFTHP